METAHVIFHDMTCTMKRQIQQLINILKESSHGVSIVSDDTDDCDLLALYHSRNVPVIIDYLVQSSAIIDIKAIG